MLIIHAVHRIDAEVVVHHRDHVVGGFIDKFDARVTNRDCRNVTVGDSGQHALVTEGHSCWSPAALHLKVAVRTRGFFCHPAAAESTDLVPAVISIHSGRKAVQHIVADRRGKFVAKGIH